MFKVLKQGRTFASSIPVHTPICIIGGGAAGINVAAQLGRNYKTLDYQIRVFEPSRKHFYQPGFTLVGGGLLTYQQVQRDTHKLLHKGVNLSNLIVTEIDPERNLIKTEDGGKYTYDQLIIAAGAQNNIGAVKGMQEALDDPDIPVATIYSNKHVQKWSRLRDNFKGGVARFTDAPPPIKCTAAPQKTVHLSMDTFKSKNIEVQAELHLNTESCFGVSFYEPSLRKALTDKKVDIHFTEKLIEINGKTREAVFLNTKTQATRVTKFDVLHTVPYQKPPEFIARSGLSDTAGYLDVDKGTLQSKKYKNIWGIGDASNLPTAKTCSAIYSQTPILLANMMQSWKDHHMPQVIYNGYTGCPALIGDKQLVLCEFKYDAKPEPTFFRQQNISSRLFYWMKVYLFPFAYFNLAPRGLWYGKDHVLNPVV